MRANRISEDIFNICKALSQKKPAPIRDVYFIPPFKAVIAIENKKPILHLGQTAFDCAELAKTSYRKIKCSSKGCQKVKWSDEFDWNKKRFEGPFQQLWGKRDSFCKECRSIERRLRYKKYKQQKKARLETNGKINFSLLGQPDLEIVKKIISLLMNTETPSAIIKKKSQERTLTDRTGV